MMKNETRALGNEPLCKKIQNYIFKFTDLLGQGNFSKVYKAHHEITNETVAVKIIELNSLKSQKLEELLFSEIDVLKKLNHQNILRCYEVFTSNRNCYIITQICNGGDLETKLRREHHFSEQSAQPIIKDIFAGLLYLSQKNVIHRDLKIANVFLHNGRAKIADFGFAKFTKENFKDINIGSPIYMSPQGLINNIYGPKTDIWAFGVLIYELLHGETPYAHCRTEAELKYSVSIPVNAKKMRAQLSPEIKQVITMCMEIDETKRITASELQNLPYFRRLMEKSPLRRMDSPVIEKKFSTASQKYIAPQKTHKQNFLSPKEEQPHLHLHLPYDKKSPLKANSRKQDTSMNQRDFRVYSTEKNMLVYNPNKNNNNSYEKNSHSTNSKNKPQSQQQPQKIPMDSKIFSTSITFKQCVNFLHYCRLIYKYVIALKETHPEEENQIRILSSWLMTLMEEIQNKINEGGIVYEGENAWLREKKLREVTSEYSKKYAHELNYKTFFQGGIPQIISYTLGFYDKIDNQINISHDPSWLPLGHYIVMLIDETYLLKKCNEQKNYRPLSNHKDLQQFLNKNKDSLDHHSYKLLRKKVSYIREKNRYQ